MLMFYLKTISELKGNQNLKEEFNIKFNHKYEITLSSRGFVIIKNLFTNKLTVCMPNQCGYIFIDSKRVNFKRLIYSKVYPNLDLTNKVIFNQIPNNFSIDNLFAVSKNELLLLKKYNFDVKKEEQTGVCYLQKSL